MDRPTGGEENHIRVKKQEMPRNGVNFEIVDKLDLLGLLKFSFKNEEILFVPEVADVASPEFVRVEVELDIL